MGVATGGAVGSVTCAAMDGETGGVHNGDFKNAIFGGPVDEKTGAVKRATAKVVVSEPD